MQVTATPRFKKAYQKLSPDVQAAVDAALVQFMANPRHPGLHFEKLKGSDYRTIRVDRKKWRIVLAGDGGLMDLIDVDRHQKVDKKYG